MEQGTGYILRKEETLEPLQQTLLKRAEEAARTQAYAPYSEFHVGAAALLRDGTIVTAGNQESISFPAGLCAERSLLATVWQRSGAIIDRIAIAAVKNGTTEPVSPCGICRQSLLDAEQRQGTPIQIIFRQGNEYVVTDSAAVLLPFAFDTF